MIERGRISAMQMAIMMYPTILATAILLVPAITAKHAKQDMWLSPVWASLIGFLTVYLAYRLHKLYPKETIVEYSEWILGRFLGKIVGLVYILFYLHVNGIVIREYGEFVVGTFLPRTPMFAVAGILVLVCAFAVRGGVEVIARSAEICVPVVFLLLLLLLVLVTPDLDPQNIFPVFEEGMMPSFKGSVVPQGWFSEFILIAFLLPYLTDKAKGKKWGMLSVLAVMLTLVMTNIQTLFLFGEITASLTYPVMVASRYISLADFLEHLESIVMAIWVAGTFIKISVFYYAIVLGTSQWLKLSDYRPLVFPVGFLLVVMSFWVAPNLQDLTHFLGTSGAFYLLSVQTGIPILLLVIAGIRKSIHPKKGLKA
ncbi:endospore germination permease [uncultured Paenibacillus sp.]|uniref:GerAB/ArcD/ProY family transporter n=1 Tax=uncultured Paenibacillus sp. TaxID=227322 RepID=UPI0028D54C57|nr:endospore germination permease [uncultured Paenibacillus sp.]